jgi:hypothetical protein
LATIYHHLLKTKPAKIAFDPVEQDKNSEIGEERPMVQCLKAAVQLPKAMIQSPKAKVQHPKSAALQCAIIPVDDSDDDLTRSPETPPSDMPPLKHRMSGRTAGNVSIAMIIEEGPRIYHASLDVENTE